MKEFDTIVLGGGPAGFAAGIYAARGAVKTAIIDINMLGGQPSNYLELENYPGFLTIGGYDLMEKFEQHADKFNVEKFPMQEIKSIDLISNPKIIQTSKNELEGNGYIINMPQYFDNEIDPNSIKSLDEIIIEIKNSQKQLIDTNQNLDRLINNLKN